MFNAREVRRRPGSDVRSQFEAFSVLKSGSHKILENLTISFCDPT